jgi:hypothetical protein
MALNPSPWDAIQKDGGLAGLVNHFDPGAPDSRETFGQQNSFNRAS